MVGLTEKNDWPNPASRLCYVPSCFKSSNIIPFPKKPSNRTLNDYRLDTSIKILKFEVDSTVRFQEGDVSSYRWEVEQMALWCRQNNLDLNMLKTVEVRVDFRRIPSVLPLLTIFNSIISAIESFRFLVL